MLRGEKNLAVPGEGFFEGANAGFAANYEGRHHVGEDDHIADGHHGQLARLGFFAVLGHKNILSFGRAKTAWGTVPITKPLLGLYRG